MTALRGDVDGRIIVTVWHHHVGEAPSPKASTGSPNPPVPHHTYRRTRERTDDDREEPRVPGTSEPEASVRGCAATWTVYDDLWATYRAAPQATKGYPYQCAKSNCRHRGIVEAPDWTARLKAIQFFVEQGYGRPPTSTETIAPKVTSRADVAALSDEELAVLARGD